MVDQGCRERIPADVDRLGLGCDVRAAQLPGSVLPEGGEVVQQQPELVVASPQHSHMLPGLIRRIAAICHGEASARDATATGLEPVPTLDGVAWVVVDVEATCCDDLRFPDSEREIIEIGAVRLDENFATEREFSEIVRPVRHPQLTEFCTQLTGIAQADVDDARGFAEVLADLVDWAGPGYGWLTSWGVYDRRQLEIDAEFHVVTLPRWFASRHVDIRRGFIRWQGIDRCSLADACKMIGEGFAGTVHRGLDDARNAAAVLAAWQQAHAALRARAAAKSGTR